MDVLNVVSTGIYTKLALTVNFIWNACKKWIAKISWYLKCSLIMLKLRKEYLNTVTHNTPVLLRMKYWTVWYIDCYSMSTYTGVANFQKTVRFFGPPCTNFTETSVHDSELVMILKANVLMLDADTTYLGNKIPNINNCISEAKFIVTSDHDL